MMKELDRKRALPAGRGLGKDRMSPGTYAGGSKSLAAMPSEVRPPTATRFRRPALRP